jgi:hypothetical protein
LQHYSILKSNATAKLTAFKENVDRRMAQSLVASLDLISAKNGGGGLPNNGLSNCTSVLNPGSIGAGVANPVSNGTLQGGTSRGDNAASNKAANASNINGKLISA